MANSTETLQTVVNLAQSHVELMPIANVGGITNEPALSLCKDVIQELFSYPLDWKFNRVEMPMVVTTPGRQDILFAGACAFTLGSTQQGWAIDLADNDALTFDTGTVTVKTLESHDFAIGDTVYLTGLVLKSDGTPSAYNSIFTVKPSMSSWSNGYTITAVADKSFSFVGSTDETSGAVGITDYGWLCSASRVEMSNTSTPQNVKQMQARSELQTTSKTSDPEKVCVLKDYGTGILKLRFVNVPGSAAWGCNLVYQAKAPNFADLDSTWAPFPDQFGYVYRQGFLAHAYRYQNSAKQQVEYEKFQARIAKALVQGDTEADDVFVTPARGLMERGSLLRR